MDDFTEFEEEERTYENVWGKATGLDQRGKFENFAAAIEASLKDLLTEKNDFFDLLADRWKELFPEIPARPGRYEDGMIFLYVKNAPLLFMVRSKLKSIEAKLSQLPGAPKKLILKAEIRE